MDADDRAPLLPRADRAPLAAVCGLALAAEVAAAWLGVAGAADLSSLGVFFDGYLYLEIARSFPLPYAAEGRALMGQAPGYPAAIWLAHGLSLGAVNWGLLAVAVAWLAGALAAGAFYLLCRDFGVRPFGPAVLFAVANPRWLGLASTAHPEPLAVLWILLWALAWRRDRLGWAALWLVLAVLTRFPALLLAAPLAVGLLLGRRAVDWRSAALLASPFLALALFDLYLHARDPGFPGILGAHGAWWQPRWSFPFLGWLHYFAALPAALPLRSLTLASGILYLAAIAVGLGGLPRSLWWLPAWVAVFLLLAAAPDDPVGVRAFTRLAVLAWPAALLVLWLRFGDRLPRPAVAAACVLLAGLSVAFAARHTRLAVQGQPKGQPYLLDSIERLDQDEPVWTDYGRYHRPRRR